MTIEDSALSERFVSAMHSPATRAQALAQRGRTFSADWIVRIGTRPHLVRIHEGRVIDCAPHLPLLHPTRLSISGTVVAWHALWEPVPRPGWHDIFALVKRGELRIEGDMQLFHAHLQYLKDLLTLPRKESR